MINTLKSQTAMHERIAHKLLDLAETADAVAKFREYSLDPEADITPTSKLLYSEDNLCNMLMAENLETLSFFWSVVRLGEGEIEQYDYRKQCDFLFSFYESFNRLLSLPNPYMGPKHVVQRLIFVRQILGTPELHAALRSGIQIAADAGLLERGLIRELKKVGLVYDG